MIFCFDLAFLAHKFPNTRNAHSTTLWTSGSAQPVDNYYLLYFEGKFEVKSDTTVVWSVNAGTNSPQLAMQDDGNLVSYSGTLNADAVGSY
jgi:hypothetical protein